MTATSWCSCPGGPHPRPGRPATAFTDTCAVCLGTYYVQADAAPAPPHREAFEAGRLATTSGAAPKHFGSPAPDLTIGANGQHRDYWILSAEERAKGFVRPVRDRYRHVGLAGATGELRDLDDAQRARYADVGYVKFEKYPPERAPLTGRYWTQAQLDRVGAGCGTVTTMSLAIAETYAREPGFYGATFCCGCGKHLPVGPDGEFVWLDGTRVGT